MVFPICFHAHVAFYSVRRRHVAVILVILVVILLQKRCEIAYICFYVHINQKKLERHALELIFFIVVGLLYPLSNKCDSASRWAVELLMRIGNEN